MQEGYSTASPDTASVQGPTPAGAEQIAAQQAADPAAPPAKKKIPWKTYLAAARANRKTLLEDTWRINVDYRVQMPFSGVGDTDQTIDRVAVPEDWARTKQKTAQLAFQVPRVQATATAPQWKAAEDLVSAAVNKVLKDEARAAYMMDECLADVINAAGLMVSVIQYDVVTDQVPGPMPPAMLDPNTQQPMPPPAGFVPPPITRKIYQRTTVDRLSPALFLWPAEFKASDWTKAPWLAYECFWPLAKCKAKWPKQITDEFKSESQIPRLLSADIEDVQTQNQKTVDQCKLTVVWYYTSAYDETERRPQAISRCIYIEGLDEPLEDGPTDWQEWVPEILPKPATDPTGQPVMGPDGAPQMEIGVPAHWRGITELPIRVATLVYVSDMAVPPSDSRAGRPQVREMIRSRSQMLRQRDHSIPIRWFDVNRVDQEVADKLRAGQWQDMIPMNGPGERAIGEVARASYPRENFQFAEQISHDLDRSWSMSPNQISAFNDTEKSASEVQITNSAAQVALDYQKQRVCRYLAEIGQQVWGIMQMFYDLPFYVEVIGPDGAKVLQSLDIAHRAGQFTFDFIADTSERLDSQTKLNMLLKAWNLMANSPSVRRQVLEKEVFKAMGLDPRQFTVDQLPPPGPKEPNISYRFGGADLLNPIAVAKMQQVDPIDPQQITAAALLIRDAVQLSSGAAPLPPSPLAGGSAPPGPGAGQDDTGGAVQITPPETPSPILKRANDGTHLT